MGQVKKAASCLGEYQPEGACIACPFEEECISATIEKDGYYDELCVLYDDIANFLIEKEHEYACSS